MDDILESDKNNKNSINKSIFSPSSGTPSSLHHSFTTISLRYLRPLRSIIVPSIPSFIRRAGCLSAAKQSRSPRSITISVTPFSLRLYEFRFAGSISAHHTSIPSANATFAQSKTLCSLHFVPPIPMLLSYALLPAHNAMLHIQWLRLTYLSGACSIAFRCVHPFAGKAAYCHSHRPSCTATAFTHIMHLHRVRFAPFLIKYTLYSCMISLAKHFSGSDAVTE